MTTSYLILRMLVGTQDMRINGGELMNMKTMAKKREGDMQVGSYHWAGWANANIFCFMIAKFGAVP